MVSRVARHMLATLCGIVALMSVQGSAFSQSPAERLRADDDRERIAEEIAAAQAKGGLQSSELIDPLTELATLYETEGEHALAAAALEEARHVVRANYGLHTLDQAPLMEQALENQQALGDFAMVRALEEELFDLAERYPDDLRTVAIHRNIGARRMDLLRRFLANEYPAEIYGEAGLFSVWRGEVAAELASEAQIHYADAAAVILRNGLNSSDTLRDLEQEIVRVSDLFRQRNRPGRHPAILRDNTIYNTPRDNFGVDRELGHPWTYTLEALQTRTDTLWDLDGSDSSQATDPRGKYVTTRYQLARESYLRLIAYEEAVPTLSADVTALRGRLDAYLQLADWDLLYSVNGVALDQYARVREWLTTTDFAEPLIAETFAPPIPITLPTFLPNPLETPASATYIDVAFEVTRFGESRRIEILGAAPNVSDAARDELASLIKASRFRPRVTDGNLARAAPVAVRYYLSD